MINFALTVPQTNILNLLRYYSNTSISNICGAVLFDRMYDKDILEQTVNEEIRLQQGLRIRFCECDGRTVQYIHEYNYVKFDYKEFISTDEMHSFGEEYARRSFSLNNSQMFRITLFELNGKSGVVMCSSHLISDAWSCSVFTADIIQIYNCLEQKKCGEVPCQSYTDYILDENRYFNSSQYISDKVFWINKYREKPENSPIKLVRTATCGVEAKRYITTLSARLSDRTDEFCKGSAISQAVVFEAAVIAYLSLINPKNSSVTIGIPVLNRKSIKEKRTIGMYVSTVPLTVSISAGESLMSLCSKISDIHRQVFRHRMYPYSNILRDIRSNTGFSGNLYDVLVSCQNAKTNIEASTDWFSNGFSEVPFSFHIDNRDSKTGYTITVDYQTELFMNDDEIPMVVNRLLHIINQIVSGNDVLLDDVSILPDDEYEKIVTQINHTDADYSRDKCVHELFCETAKNNRGKTALLFDDMKFTYERLDEMSNAVAHRLREKGIKPNEVVGIIAVRSPYIIVAMMGILKSGGAYMPVSPEYPAQRIDFMLETAGCRLALTYGCSCRNAEEIPLQEIDYTLNTQRVENVNRPDDLCYVIFTSGSTGKPKGTSVTHRNVVNYCACNDFNVCGKIIRGNHHSIVSVTNFIFDIFVTESIFALLNGIKIYLADDSQIVSQKELSRLISDKGIDIIQTTPTKMRSYILDKNNLGFLSTLKIIILGGEEFPADLYTKLREHSQAEIYNIYGPAETTVWSTIQLISDGRISIGLPIANTRIYILGLNGKPVPIGIAGELCISGDGVGKGYINMPELTAQRFLCSTFAESETIYRTGDFVRMRTDNSIEFLGRIDTQVKIHGLRIELGEIESVMSCFDGICLAAVTDKLSDSGRQYLAGYYTSDVEIDEKKLCDYLVTKLPSYMVPNYFMRLSEIPVTPSGKIDRKNLPIPDLNCLSADYEEPETEKEKILCDIVSDLLEVDHVGVNDDFFMLGGDSLGSIQYVTRAHEKGIEFSLQSISECRTVRKLCLYTENHSDENIKEESFDEYPGKRTRGDLRLFGVFAKLTKMFYRFEVDGIENLDRNKAYIFCPNHESDLDCMWVLTALGKAVNINNICALIASEHLEKAVHRRIFRITGGIPLDRNGDFVPAMKRALNVIMDMKHSLIIHPEGTRTRNGDLGIFKKGAALLSIKSGLSVVPVCINGAHDIFPPDRKVPGIINFRMLKKYPLRITFGTPIEPYGKNENIITEEIRSMIINIKSGGRDDYRN
ncbi:MAG: amino acid adenylation domain-containing protein [Oscillospiraceae bacterium]|nr:amino acid adenylation domain-containing protein [Oscillospiraceae bacterium]